MTGGFDPGDGTGLIGNMPAMHENFQGQVTVFGKSVVVVAADLLQYRFAKHAQRPWNDVD